MEYLFVYGTLKKGFGNHDLLESANFIGEGFTESKYKMLSLGGFPGVVDGTKEIWGELYQVENLNSIDTLEGYPNFYGRERTTIYIPFTDRWKKVKLTEAWIYKLMDARYAYEEVKTGVWCKR